MRTVFISAIALLGIATPSHAIDGNILLQECNAAVTLLDGGSAKGDYAAGCLSYLLGFNEAHGIMVEGKRKPLYCAPAGGVEGSQLARIMAKFLNNHPELLHINASTIVMMGFSQAFPCPTKNRKAEK